MTPSSIRARLLLVRLAVLVIFMLLAAQLWRLQILEGGRFSRQADGNRIRVETVNAPRGVMYDRRGRILIRNEPSFQVSLVPAGVPGTVTNTLLIELASLLDLPLTDAQALAHADKQGRTDEPAPIDASACVDTQTNKTFYGLRECFNYVSSVAPYRRIILSESTPREIAFAIRERGPELPGVLVNVESQRHYLYGPLFAHMLGYVAPITQDFLERASKRFEYEPNDVVGTAGLEAGAEALVRGRKGHEVVEKDVVGREVRVLQEVPPVPGSNVFLTVDLDLQREVTRILRAGLEKVGSPQGVAILMNPQTGEILAMVSLPSYDDNLFIGGISPADFQQLLDDPHKPLLNLAIGGFGFPPGSIFKLVTAAGALEDGVITRDTTIFDPGSIRLPNKLAPDDRSKDQIFVCWKRTGHGDQKIVEAIAHSCDVFFYEVGGGYTNGDQHFEGLGIERLDKWASAFGLGELTSIDLPGESAGLVPTPKWKRLAPHINESWVTGDTYNMAIGQGYLIVTPLQMLNVTAAVANGGTLYRPQLIYQVQDADGHVVSAFEPGVLRHVPVKPEHLATIREGMLGAVEWKDGTAHYAGLPTGVRIAGKTGTAEYCDGYQKPDGSWDCRRDKDGHQVTHAWFTAFAPYENPEVALIVFVHGNGKDVLEGSEVAAPIAAEILRYYFDQWPREQRGPPAAASPTDTTTPTPPPEGADPTALPAPTRPANTTRKGFGGSLLRSEPSNTNMSVVSGRVVDTVGNPLPGVVITVDGGGAPVATLTTGPDGAFRYDLLNPVTSPRWNIRAPDLAGSPFVTLQVQGQAHYIVLFQEAP
ncbi:MAG TPA: penicillin-binding protein 2 [Chloroflexi bacterium]|nr:penicillin-binding protein 2 [Chloroflexota bacterium]